MRNFGQFCQNFVFVNVLFSIQIVESLTIKANSEISSENSFALQSVNVAKCFL